MVVLASGCGAPPAPGLAIDSARIESAPTGIVDPSTPFAIVLGIGQDAGVPQAGQVTDPRWDEPERQRLAASLGLVDPVPGHAWLFDATPDFPEQLTRLVRARDASRPPAETERPPEPRRLLEGIFLTHAHMGHYVGLAHVGHEAMGGRDIPVYAMPRMRAFLEGNGPWDQLVRFGNIQLMPLEADAPLLLNARLSVTALRVPHRQEYSEVVGYSIAGPSRRLLYIPDIDGWAELDEAGHRIEDWVAAHDFALLDATFFDRGEIPGRDMSGFPHPFIAETIERFAPLPDSLRNRVVFIHLNHTNPALDAASAAATRIRSAGMRVAARGETFAL